MLDRTVICDGFSKTYAMTGWRLGYMIVPPALAERLELLLTHSIGCTAAFTQVAGIEALTGPQEMIAEIVAEYQRRRDFIVAGLNAIPGVTCRIPQGAFYVFPNVKSFGLSSKEIARGLIDEAGVAVLAGSDFGSGGEGYLRLCYATSMEVLKESLDKMGGWFKTCRKIRSLFRQNGIKNRVWRQFFAILFWFVVWIILHLPSACGSFSSSLISRK